MAVNITAYDEETRTFFVGTERIGLGSQTPGYEINSDGSVGVYFGPTPPKRHEKTGYCPILKYWNSAKVSIGSY